MNNKNYLNEVKIKENTKSFIICIEGIGFHRADLEHIGFFHKIWSRNATKEDYFVFDNNDRLAVCHRGNVSLDVLHFPPRIIF